MKLMEEWQQIGGDMSPGSHGAVIARMDGDCIEIREIQPVREYVGDDEALAVGYPWWSKEACYDPSDLDPSLGEVSAALRFCGLDLDDIAPESRPVAIAEACLRYGHLSEEGSAGWASDVVPGHVSWLGGEVGGPELFRDDEDDFRRACMESEVKLGSSDVGCLVDSTFGHDHVRAVLAALLRDAFPDEPGSIREICEELDGPMSFDAAEEFYALEILNDECCEDGFSVDFMDGDLVIHESEQE